jgi:hypothetical protein
MPKPRLAGFAFAFALHLGAIGLLVWLSMPTRSGDPAGRQPAISAAPKPPPTPTSREAERLADIDRYLPRPPDVSVWGFTFDLRKVRSRWSDLFPFVTAPPRLDVDAAARRASSTRGFVFVDPDRIPASEPPARPALAMSPSGIQQLIDRAWSRRERWSRFARFVNLANGYHPDDGRLPAVIRAYVAQNMLQPYEEMSLPDPTRWMLLVLAADDRDYLEFVEGYVRAHPGTRGSTEMLFLVDALMQGSRASLNVFFRTNPRRDLQWTYQENTDAFWLFDSLREHYRKVLAERGLTSAGAIERYYDAERLKLLETVLRQTPDGYRASDARFVIGKIHWAQGERRAAIREWRRMQVAPGDAFVTTYARVLQAMAARPAGGEEPDPATVAAIDAALQAERAQQSTFQFDRLRRFGHGPYTF